MPEIKNYYNIALTTGAAPGGSKNNKSNIGERLREMEQATVTDGRNKNKKGRDKKPGQKEKSGKHSAKQRKNPPKLSSKGH